jgi:hypothetical protein
MLSTFFVLDVSREFLVVGEFSTKHLESGVVHFLVGWACLE